MTKTKAGMTQAAMTRAARDLQTAPDVLLTYAGKAVAVDRLLARHPNAPAQLLEQLSHSGDKATRKSVAIHPAASTQVLLKLAPEFPRDLLKNPVFDLLLLENPNLKAVIGDGVLKNILKRPDCPSNFMTWAAEHGSEEERSAVLNNPQASALVRLKVELFEEIDFYQLEWTKHHRPLDPDAGFDDSHFSLDEIDDKMRELEEELAYLQVVERNCTETLLKGGAEVDAPLSMDHNGIAVGGCTALYVAALLGHLPSCKVLASSGASLEAANDLGYTPLMAAIEGDHDDVIDFFLESGANVNPEVIAKMEVEGLGGASPLYTATRKENFAVIKKLLKRGVDVNRPTPNGWTPLKSAAQQGSLAIVKALLRAGADPNIADDTNYTPLMNAVIGDHEDIVKILLKFNADPNIQCGENPEDDDWESGRSALMDAAVSGNVAIARELLKGGANPNLVSSKGTTALHSTVISASTDMVALLLKSGANPNVFGNGEEKISALDLALRRWASEGEDDRKGGISDLLELMVKKGMPSDRGSLNEAALDLVIEGLRQGGRQGLRQGRRQVGSQDRLRWRPPLMQGPET